MKKSYPIILAILVLAGCNENADQEMIINSNSLTIESFPETSNYTFTKLTDYTEGTPYKFYEVDSGLYIFDIKGRDNKIFHFYNLEKHEFTQNFIGKGHGPNESFSPHASGLKNGKLWVFDFTMRKIIETDLINLEEKEIRLPYYFNHIEILNEKENIGNVLSNSNFKFQKIDKQTGKLISEFGVFDKIPEGINDELLHEYFQSSFSISPNEKKLVSVYRWHDAIEIFDLETLESKLFYGAGNINNDFGLVIGETGDLILDRGGDMVQCTVDISVTDNYIYKLFSGITESVVDYFYCNTVLVYDWEGNPIKQIQLDRKVMSFSVSPDDSRLYSFDVNTGEVIYVDLEE